MKKALINIKNEDDESFKLHVALGLSPDLMEGKDPQRVTKELRKRVEELNWNGIESLTPCSGWAFEKFGMNNDVSVLVFGYCDGEIIPLHVPVERRKRIVRLFFYKNEDGTESHYSLIKNMSRLVSSQISKKKAKKHICDFCLNSFGTQDLLDTHVESCSKHGAVNTVLPKPGYNDILKFKNIQNSIECPVAIYFDGECFLEETDETRGNTKLYQQHVLSAFCIYVASRVEGFSMDPIVYVCQNEDDDVSKIFDEKLKEVTRKIHETFKEPRPMIFDEAARKCHESQQVCYSCGGGFNNKSVKYRKVRDHCHYTAKYRGALHNTCNLEKNSNHSGVRTQPNRV